ncbi:hypothetical protein Q31b_41790 [Novipirellula aureliae]|uniref:Uncharacterized protein n=1 Tax=Novipirellula aureliae TaxID=2527966 RepID=A0A5C6DT41_9BACT|nr:hypothetical protein [Novipirellula aureliae]TWU39097.1 hypothetical protein Q31b_41790 [Novipirellula aureliae]
MPAKSSQSVDVVQTDLVKQLQSCYPVKPRQELVRFQIVTTHPRYIGYRGGCRISWLWLLAAVGLVLELDVPATFCREAA